MNIAVFIKNTTLHKGFGGFEVQNKLLCEGLASKGHHVFVFSPKKELEMFSHNENGVEYVFVPCVARGFNLLFSLFSKTWRENSVESFLTKSKTLNFDLVIGQSSGALGLIDSKKNIEIPIISILHGSKMGEFQSRIESISGIKEFLRLLIDIPHVFYSFFFSQRAFVHGSDKLVAVSNFVKNSIIEETFVSADKVEVVHNGVKPPKNLITDSSKPADEKVNFVYLGRLDASKGVQILIKAFASADFQGCVLHIVGSGPYLGQLEYLVKKYKLMDRVIFHGSLKYEQVLVELMKMDVFILPTLRVEGFPMTIIEAMLCALPVIASDKGGNSDAVVHERTGFLVESGNVEQLKHRMLELQSNVELRKKLGKEGKIMAQQQFTFDVMIDKYERIIQEVVNEYSKTML